MPSRRHLVPRSLLVLVGALALTVGGAVPAHAAPVVSEVPGGELVASLTEYEGLMYVGSEAGLQSFDGTTFTTIPGAPESPRNFVEYLGDLWMIGGPATGGASSLWRFDGSTLTEVADALGQPVVVNGRLYFVAYDIAGFRYLSLTDGSTTAVFPLSPTDVGEIAADPNGLIALTAGASRTLWSFDGTVFIEVMQPGAPVNVDQLTTLDDRLVFDGQEVPGGDDVAFAWDGSAFTQLGAAGGGAADPDCFLEAAGSLLYSASDGSRQMYSADPAVAGSEVPLAPTIPNGCPRFVASDGTLYLQAQAAPGADPTLHTWDGATLTQLDTVANFPSDLLEYGGAIYFTGQAVSETPSLFVLRDDVTPPTIPTAPTLPPTGGEVSPALVVVAVVLVAGGLAAVVVTAIRRRRA